MDKYLTLVNFQNEFKEEMKKGFKYIDVDVNKDMNPNKEFIEINTYEAFRALQKALIKKGISITLNSAGRTPEEQQKYYEHVVETEGQEEADNKVAKGGFSEHHLGLCVDVRIRSSNVLSKIMVKLSNKDIKKVVHSMLAEYGFIYRYPSNKKELTGVNIDEDWHFRYVGVEHAKEMKRLNMCLEEYIQYLKQKENIELEQEEQGLTK